MKQRIFTFIAAALLSVMAGNASVVFDWTMNIGSISYVGGATATTVKTQTNTVSTACIKFLAKYDKGDYVELTSSTGSFLAGDIITIDYCINNSDASKVGRVAVYTANDSLLAESEPAVNGRLEDGYSTFQYQLRSDMNVIRIARGPSTGTATYILRLEVTRGGGTIEPQPVEYSVTAYASPSNGGYVDVQYNADHSYAYLTAYPSTGYQFAGWSDGRTDNPRTIALSEDLNLTAYFTQTIPSEYWYWKGYVDGYDIVTENNNNIFQNGISSITVDAYAYLFVIHQKSGYPGEQYMSEYYVDGPTHATMTKTGMEKIRIPVGTHTLYLYDNGDGTVELAYQPMAGKTLIGNGQPSVQYTVTANVNPSTAGYVNVQYDNKHHQATLTAYPYSGYHFSCWSDGNTDNPRTLLLESNVTLTANFTKDITSGPQVWPIMMDETTYASIQSSVVADFRPNDYSNFVFSWDDSYSVANNYGLNFYGLAEGWLSFIVGTKGWAGGSFYVEDDYQSVEILRQTIVANPDDYYLHFAIKSTDNYSHTFYIIDNDQTNFAIGTTNSYYAGGPIYGDFARDGDWHEFFIPMGLFADALSTSSITSGVNLFCFLTQGVQGAQLNLDAVYFCNTAFKNSQTKPTYTVTTNAFPSNSGYVEVTGPSARNLVTMTAIPNTGYHFLRWNDGNLENPRTFILTQDTTFNAIFEHDLMHVTYIGMNGEILGTEEVPYGERAHQAGINPDVFGYTFLGWDKPLTNITEDITVYATYKRDAVNGFYYIYDRATQTATLDREGDSYKQMKVLNVPNRFIYRGLFFSVIEIGAYAFEGCDRLTDVVVPSNVEYIRESAFSGCSDMIRLTVSANLRGIEDYAFQGCKRLEEITVYAERVPDLTATSFANVGNKKYINVYVPDNRVNQYKRDEYWSEFNIVVKSAETITENVEDVTVEPEESTAQFTWPTESNAGSYTIVITKDGVVICTLIFNANGQLSGIAFAPGRDGNNAPAAVLTSNGGMQFTVTGLDAGTHYGYTVTTKDAQDRVLATYEGEFDTTGSMEDGIEWIQVNGEGNGKFLHIGQIYIFRNGKLYTVTGQVVQ